MRKRFFFIYALVLLLPLAAEAAGAPRTFRELVVDIVAILSDATATILALAIAIFVWNIAKNMTVLGENKIKERNAFLLWGTIIIFVIVSIWGILSLLRNSIFQGDQPRPIQTSIELKSMAFSRLSAKV
jgi:hypothetical protein